LIQFSTAKAHKMLKISQTDSVSLTGQFTSSQAGFYAVSGDTEDASVELVGQ